MTSGPGTRWRIVVAYHGAAFVGWQVQPNGPSVQGALEAALERLLGERVHVAGSGRTDSGVHAHGQVASFVTAAVRTPRSIRDGLNAMLPQTVACVHAEVVPLDFDPRRWTRHKHYRYTWLDRPARSPLFADRAWHVRHALDERAMQHAASHLRGTHDFSAFRAVGCAAAHAVRTVDALTVQREGPLVTLDVHGNGFLRHMIRIVAGSLTDVGRGRHSAEWMASVLQGQDRGAAGRTAPAHGLTLVSVTYGDEAPPWHRSGPLESGPGDVDPTGG